MLVASDRDRAVPAADAPIEQAAQGLQQFGYELISRNPGVVENGNLVVSPASIGAAFAMARAGARGETAAQIDAVLHYPPNGLGDAYNSLTRDWSSRSGDDSAEVSIANGVFAQQGFGLEPAYLDTLAADFGTGVRQVDFAGGSAAGVINDWVRTQTRDRIKALADGFDPDTVLVLANAVYLKATWERVFLADLTREAPFHTADGRVVRTPTMVHKDPEPYAYAATSEWSAVRLPYVGGQLAMWVLLPAAEDGDPVLLLDPAVLDAARSHAHVQRVDLALPKWDTQTNLGLTSALEALGMTAPFGPGADFTGISPDAPNISEVIHRADITVDELGTKAAAVTGLVFVVSAPPPPEAVMHVDHPFAFVVMHEPTGAPLFEGVVGDPTVSP